MELGGPAAPVTAGSGPDGSPPPAAGVGAAPAGAAEAAGGDVAMGGANQGEPLSPASATAATATLNSQGSTNRGHCADGGPSLLVSSCSALAVACMTPCVLNPGLAASPMHSRLDGMSCSPQAPVSQRK